MVRNPLETDPDYERRVRERAYHLWEADGKPHGRDLEFWERARELIGMEESAGSGLLPNPESAPPPLVAEDIGEADIQQNLGEFPGQREEPADAPAVPAKRRARPRTRKT